MLNTDWTVAGNTKQVQVITSGAAADFSVTEGQIREITLLEDGFLWTEDTAASLTKTVENEYVLCCMQSTVLHQQTVNSCVLLDGVPVSGSAVATAGNHIVTVK